jgi:hypothetical protein
MTHETPLCFPNIALAATLLGTMARGFGWI